MDLRGRPLVQPMTPRGEDKGTKDFLGKEAEKYVDDEANMTKLKNMGEVMARSYASWLQWWKNTINSDDYIKYLSTQESDYMGVVFHFYNSDDEDDEDDSGGKNTNRTSKKAQKLSEEREKKKEDRKSTRLKLQSHHELVCRLLLEKKKQKNNKKKNTEKTQISEKSRHISTHDYARTDLIHVFSYA